MGNLTSNFWRLIYSLTPYFLLLHHTLLLSVVAQQSKGKSNIIAKHLYFPDFNPNPITDHIKLLGSSKISSEEASIHIPNIDDHNLRQAGRAIFSSPIRLFDPSTLTSASFNTTFSFYFSTPTNGTLIGDGLAFVIVPDEFAVGRPGPWMGILNDACAHYKVFAVEFDTAQDPEVGDSSNDHIGINVGTIVSSKVANLSSSPNGLSLHNQLIHRVWISYNNDKKWIDVYFGLDANPKPPIPILSSSLNLDHIFNEYMFVGFSASSENSTQIHHILSWNFSSSVQSFSHLPSKHICRKNVARQVSKFSGSADSESTSSSFFIFLCVLGLVCVVLINLYFSSKRRQKASPLKKQRPVLPNIPHQFNFMEIHRATHGFSKEHELGKGSNWVLYKAILPNRCIALKRFEIMSNYKQLLNRISVLSCTEHSKLASIRGWCCEKREMMIAYDYFPNGSVDKWLAVPGFGVLPWSLRLEVIKEIAETLSFLHSRDIPHRNIRSSSVFFDVNKRAILGDYGFSMLTETCDAGKKHDVFMFGVFVLEIVAGKRGDEEEIMGLGWEMHERGEKVKMVDERIGSCVNLKEAVRVLEIGLRCTLVKINGKPSMEEVVKLLNFRSQIPKLPRTRPLELLPKNK
ncbi:probable L-type lectin-domain containing receptor kinase S.7 [Euphorbia lathyris]|uniref:probable L-type lectin-domain containing receptor kinase S.7 n=1 Tax=Euphorbia lathyris TaxID=212925 RepID=UPI003313D59E